MSLERAHAMLLTAVSYGHGEVRDFALQLLEEIESPEDRRKRRERDKKRAQRANGRKEPEPPDKVLPVPVVSPIVSPAASPSGAVDAEIPSRALPSLSRSSSSSPLSLLSPSETPSQTAESARGKRRKGARVSMPDPDADPRAFEAFVRRWKLPLSPDLSPSVSPPGPLSDIEREARKFMAYVLKNDAQYVRWDWAWRDWLARAGDFPSNGSGVHRAAPPVDDDTYRPPPEEPTTPATKDEIRAAVQQAIRPSLVGGNR